MIGVNTAILSPGGGSVGIGFSVPSDLVQKIVADLADDGTITRGWLGVQIRPMTDEVAQVLGYGTPKGAVIEAVGDDSPAKKAGLEQGDIILSFDGTDITHMREDDLRGLRHLGSQRRLTPLPAGLPSTRLDQTLAPPQFRQG